jgi:hypothetical protein
MMKRAISALIVLTIAGCASTRSKGQQGSASHPPEPQIIQTLYGQPPNGGPIPVTLTADGYFTAEGMRISFLRECAETTLRDGNDSFALFHYAMMEPRPRHYEARGDIVETHGHYDERSKNVFDARKVLADPGFK